MSNFKEDSIFSAVKDFKQDIAGLEQRLNDLRAKRRSLEREQETAAVKHNQVFDTYKKMQEMLKVARHKVLQTQEQIDSIEKENLEKKKSIALLNQRLQEMEKKNQQEVQDFENRLIELADLFKTARDDFSPHSLDAEIEVMEKSKSFKDDQVLAFQDQLENMRTNLAKMDMNDSNNKQLCEVPPETQVLIYSILEEDFNRLNEKLDMSLKKCDELQSELDSWEQQQIV